MLSARRDLGAGLWRPPPGPASAAPGLRSPLTLAWRLHKGALIAWSMGLVFVGVALGLIAPAIAEGVGEMLTGIWPERWAKMVAAAGARQAFIAISIYILALLAGANIYAVATVLQLRREESENLAELILARPASRSRWMSSYLIRACAGSAFLLLALGFAAALGWGLASGDVGAVLPAGIGLLGFQRRDIG